MQRIESADDFEAVQTGHGNVHHGHIGHFCLHRPQGFASVRRLGTHLHVAALFDQPAQAGANDAVVIC